MAFQMATGGSGWRLAGSLIQLGHEVAAAYPALTCLGTIGDTAHQSEGTASDHNPFVHDPHTGVGIVRAIDIGGPDDQLRALRQKLWVLYAQQDPRLYYFGYGKGCSDNLINNWGLPFKVHIDDGDAGHLHISVSRLGDTGYAPAIDSTAGWGISGGVNVAHDALDGADILAIHNDTLGIWRAQEISNIITAATSKAFTSGIDYEKLAASIISQLVAAKAA